MVPLSEQSPPEAWPEGDSDEEEDLFMGISRMDDARDLLISFTGKSRSIGELCARHLVTNQATDAG